MELFYKKSENIEMNNNILVKLFFLIIFYVVSLYAQNDFMIKKVDNTSVNDSINPSSYFPMVVNNFWQYSFLNDVVREELVYKDSIINDSSKAYFLLTNGVPFIFDPDYIVENFKVYSGHHVPEFRDLYWKLDAELGEQWWVFHLTSDTTTGVYRKVEAIYDGTYLGINTSFKEIAEYTRELIDSSYLDIFRFRYWLAAGLGLVMTTTDQMGEPPTYLNSAIINGDTIGTIVSVKDIETESLLPEVELSQNYPNPFNSTTNINFILREPAYIHISLFNILGQEIKTVQSEFFTIGEYSVKLNMEELPSGIYIYSLTTESAVFSKKINYLK